MVSGIRLKTLAILNDTYDFLPDNRCGKDAFQGRFLPEVNETNPLPQQSLIKLAPQNPVQPQLNI